MIFAKNSQICRFYVTETSIGIFKSFIRLRGAIFLSIGNTFIGQKSNEKKVSCTSAPELVMEVQAMTYAVIEAKEVCQLDYCITPLLLGVQK